MGSVLSAITQQNTRRHTRENNSPPPLFLFLKMYDKPWIVVERTPTREPAVETITNSSSDANMQAGSLTTGRDITRSRSEETIQDLGEQQSENAQQITRLRMVGNAVPENEVEAGHRRKRPRAESSHPTTSLSPQIVRHDNSRAVGYDPDISLDLSRRFSNSEASLQEKPRSDGGSND